MVDLQQCLQVLAGRGAGALLAIDDGATGTGGSTTVSTGEGGRY